MSARVVKINETVNNLVGDSFRTNKKIKSITKGKRSRTLRLNGSLILRAEP